MATSQKLTDQFLTCAVCSEVFIDPVTLDCYHTFCRKCLVRFAKTKPAAITAKSLPCAMCRRLTKVIHYDRPVEDWANQVKPSFLIQGLIDSFGPGTKDSSNCNLCHEEGETAPAVAWCPICDVSLCEGCLKGHRRNPASRHHDVSDFSGEVKVGRKRKVPCVEHKDEFIKFYCKTCKKILCQTCCILHHRSCQHVLLLESLVPEIQSALKRRKDTLASMVEDTSALLAKTKSNWDEIQKNKVSMQSQVRLTCQKVIDEVKTKEKILIHKIEEVSEKQMCQLKSEIKSTEMTMQMYRQDTEMISQALESENEVELYSLYQSYESGNLESLDDADAELKDTETYSRIRFIQDIDQLNKTLEELQLGDIDVMYESGLDLKATLVLHKTIDVRVTGDKHVADPVDVTVLHLNGVDTIVVTDQGNTSVKSFYSRNNQPCHSKLSLDSHPWSLTQLKHNQVAITLPSQNQIVTTEVNPDLKLLSTITTQKQYRGIALLTQTTLAVSSLSPPCVDVLDMAGNVLKSINSTMNNQNIIVQPFFICTTKKSNILVSDNGTKSVLCMTPQGYEVFISTPTRDRTLRHPYGVTVTNTGDILFADWSLDVVLHLTESGQLVRNILTSQHDLQNPRGICVDKHGRLNVASSSGFVKVFKVSK